MLNPARVSAPYEIMSAIGSSGMGEVYKARDTRIGRTVAIKILSPRLAKDPHFRARFDREARAMSQLNHPHICTLNDVGEAGAVLSPSGAPGSYFVMEFVEGQTLAERLHVDRCRRIKRSHTQSMRDVRASEKFLNGRDDCHKAS